MTKGEVTNGVRKTGERGCCRGCKAFLSSAFHIVRFPRKCPQGFVFFPEPVKQVRRTHPHAHQSALIALVVDLFVLILYHCGIKVDNFQAKVLVDEKVVGFDVPVGDTVFMKIRKSLEAPADLNFKSAGASSRSLNDLAFKLLRSEYNVNIDAAHFR